MRKSIYYYNALKKNIKYKENIQKKITNLKWYNFSRKIKYLIIKKALYQRYDKLCDNFFIEMFNENKISEEEKKRLHTVIMNTINKLQQEEIENKHRI